MLIFPMQRRSNKFNYNQKGHNYSWDKMDDKNKNSKPDRFTKIENKGFNFANKMHKFAINGCLIFIGYQLYVFLREYNDFFLNARKIKKMDQFDQDGPINKDLAE